MALSALLETEDRDLALYEGNLVLVRDARVVTQRIENRFRFFLGEWFLNGNEGVPYFQRVLLKNPDIGVVRQIFLQIILTTPGMADVPNFDMQFDSVARTLSYQWVGVTTTGEIVNGDNAFIIREEASA